MPSIDKSALSGEPPEAQQLNFDLDVDICIVGAGLAGLTVALESRKMGASVAVLEARTVGWGASGCQLGTVMPGFGTPLGDLIERIGLDEARLLWGLSREGADYVRDFATRDPEQNFDLSEGALEVSNVDVGDALISRLQTLGEDFGTEVEGWQVDRVREALRTQRYFHGVYYPKAFQVDGRKYLLGLAAAARQAGVRIFENTPVVGIDPSGIRKRIVTPQAKLRASHIVLAGNVHLGSAWQRLSETLLPVWRYAGVTEPLGDKLSDIIRFAGSVGDTDGIDHFRVVDGTRLMWSSPETTWAARPNLFRLAIRRRIASVFPQLGIVEIAEMRGGACGETVHGMPQIGELRKGLWVASGFGRQGLATSAMAGVLVARSIFWGDDNWKMFSPFELVWAGGRTGRAAGFAIEAWRRRTSAAAGALSRYRERARIRETTKETRLATANRLARRAGRPERPRPPETTKSATPSVAGSEAEIVPAQPDEMSVSTQSQDRE